jgi:hypothetical protein
MARANAPAIAIGIILAFDGFSCTAPVAVDRGLCAPGRRRKASCGVFSDNVGSRMTLIEALDIRAIELIARAAASRGGDRSARLKD